MLKDFSRAGDEGANTHRPTVRSQRVYLIPSSMPLGHRGSTDPGVWFCFRHRWVYHRTMTQKRFRNLWSLLFCLAHIRGAKLEKLVYVDLEGRAIIEGEYAALLSPISFVTTPNASSTVTIVNIGRRLYCHPREHQQTTILSRL